jgi:Domain of unknown function (DUF3291)
MAQLDTINALAEQSPGFVWRLQSDSGNATDIPYNNDPLTLVNMSTWESIEALRDFTYRSGHVAVLRDRAKWFEPHAAPHYCLWWIPAGHIPTVKEAQERLDHYRRNGPTGHAFWFGQTFPAPVESGPVELPITR